jgi:hypothetical protein
MKSNMKIIILICIAASSLVLSGCSIFEASANQHSLTDNSKTAYWFDYDSNRRGAFFIPGDQKFKVISEPSPDTATEAALKLAGSLNYQSVTGQVSADLSSQIVQLGQRTEMIMFLRETMFRLSEAGNNAGWSADDYKALYTQIVNASITLAEAERTQAEANKTNAVAKVVAAEAARAKEENTAKTLQLYQETKESKLLDSLKSN